MSDSSNSKKRKLNIKEDIKNPQKDIKIYYNNLSHLWVHNYGRTIKQLKLDNELIGLAHRSRTLLNDIYKYTRLIELINKGASIDAFDIDLQTPAMISAMKPDGIFLKILINNGNKLYKLTKNNNFRIVKSINCEDVKDNNNNKITDYTWVKNSLIENGPAYTITELITNKYGFGKTIQIYTNNDTLNLLNKEIKSNKQDKQIALNKKLLSICDKKNFLYDICPINEVNFLLKLNADINYINYNTPIITTALKDNINLLKFLLEKNADINKPNINNKNLLDIDIFNKLSNDCKNIIIEYKNLN